MEQSSLSGGALLNPGEEEESKKAVGLSDIWCRVEFQLPDILFKGEKENVDDVADSILESYRN